MTVELSVSLKWLHHFQYGGLSNLAILVPVQYMCICMSLLFSSKCSLQYLHFHKVQSVPKQKMNWESLNGFSCNKNQAIHLVDRNTLVSQFSKSNSKKSFNLSRQSGTASHWQYHLSYYQNQRLASILWLWITICIIKCQAGKDPWIKPHGQNYSFIKLISLQHWIEIVK